MLYGKTFCIDQIKDLDNQHWKEIDDTEGLIFISDKGRVKSYKGYKAIILKPFTNQGGYARVDITISGFRQNKFIHTLVAAAFLPLPQKLDMQLHHKDFDKTNNTAENLVFLTAAQHRKIHRERNRKQNVST